MARNKDFERLLELMYLARYDRFGNQAEARQQLDSHLDYMAHKHGISVEEIEIAMHACLMDYCKERRKKKF